MPDETIVITESQMGKIIAPIVRESDFNSSGVPSNMLFTARRNVRWKKSKDGAVFLQEFANGAWRNAVVVVEQ